MVTEKGSRYTLNHCKNKESNMEQHWQDKEKQHLKQCSIRPVIEYSSDSILKARTAIGNAHDSVRFEFFYNLCMGFTALLL